MLAAYLADADRGGPRSREDTTVIDIAYCGLDCGACPAFHAGERLTMDERRAVAEQWNVEFGGNHTAADIDCVGCTHAGVHAPHCEYGCDIRKSASARGVATCAECPEYMCETLSGFLANVPDAKANLEARRAN
jgi:hypothetical protein